MFNLTKWYPTTPNAEPLWTWLVLTTQFSPRTHIYFWFDNLILKKMYFCQFLCPFIERYALYHHLINLSAWVIEGYFFVILLTNWDKKLIKITWLLCINKNMMVTSNSTCGLERLNTSAIACNIRSSPTCCCYVECFLGDC